MKWIKYSRYTPEDLDISSEDLMRALADFFLQSGFDNPYYPTPGRAMSFEQLREALEHALYEDRLLDAEKMEQIQVSADKAVTLRHRFGS